jgi:hypothetical protein
LLITPAVPNKATDVQNICQHPENSSPPKVHWYGNKWMCDIFTPRLPNSSTCFLKGPLILKHFSPTVHSQTLTLIKTRECQQWRKSLIKNNEGPYEKGLFVFASSGLELFKL